VPSLGFDARGERAGSDLGARSQVAISNEQLAMSNIVIINLIIFMFEFLLIIDNRSFIIKMLLF